MSPSWVHDFLFIAGQLYVDGEPNERMRGAAQGFIAFILWGGGNFVGSTLAGKSQALHTLDSRAARLPMTGMVFGFIRRAAVLVLFLIFFRDPPKKLHTGVLIGRREEDLETERTGKPGIG